MDITEPDPRGLQQAYGGVTYGSPLCFEGVPQDDFRDIKSITWFMRTAIDGDDENGFNQLSLYP